MKPRQHLKPSLALIPVLLLAWLGVLLDAQAQTAPPPSVLVKQSGFRLVTAPALGDDGRFYAGIAGGVVAFDSSTLVAVWGPNTICGASFGRWGVSVGSNDMVFAVGDWNECGNGPLGVLAGSDGSTLWNYNNSIHPRHVPALDESRSSVYYGVENFQSLNYNAHSVNWSVPRNGNGGRGLVLDRDGNVYYGSGDASITSYTPDKNPRWSKSSGNRVLAVASGYVFLSGQSLEARNTSDGNVAWQALDLANPVSDKSGNIYANAMSAAQVVSLTAGGVERWRVSLPGVSSAAVDFATFDGKLVVRGDSNVFLINLTDGVIDWSFTADNPLTVPTTLARHGRMFLSDAQGTGYLLRTTLDYAASEWPIAEGGNRRHTGKAFDTLALPGLLIIYRQPTNQTVVSGMATIFSVEAAGVAPFFYQWFFNGTNPLFGQTNSSLTLTNIALAQAGKYSVLVSNSSGSLSSSNATMLVLDSADSDQDGIPNYWEVKYGLDPTNHNDVGSRPTGDKLTFLQKYLYGLNPTTPDSDGDGLSDFDELFIYGTDPMKADTDGDGMPDGWELANGLNPRINDANGDLDGDGLTNLQEYNLWLANHVQRPDRVDSVGDGRGDYERSTGGQTNRFYYDKNDRLIGAEYSRGVSIAYTYDGNNNLTRQTVLSRAGETNGLPVLWRFLNGLTNNTGTFVDTDGDGWTDYQEWKAGTNPRDAASKPGLNGNPGLNIASLQLPFTPTNFVMGTGQLDGLGAEEIVIGGDGDPGTNTNFLLVLTQGATGWSTQRVDVGPFGITSIAVGQPTNRPSAGIYVGLRGTTNGSGQVMEFTRNGGVWQSNVVAFSTNEAAFVLGVRKDTDLVVSYAVSNTTGFPMISLSYSSGKWTYSILDTNSASRGLGLVAKDGITAQTTFRLLDQGGVAVNSEAKHPSLPTNAVYRAASGSWYFITSVGMTWPAAESFAQSYGGHLASISDANENDFLRSMLISMGIGGAWIGLNDIAVEGTFVWSSGEPVTFQDWFPGEPNNQGDEDATFIFGSGHQWNDLAASTETLGVIEISVGVTIIPVTLPEPSVSHTKNWRGLNLAAGISRRTLTNAYSLLYSFGDDKGGDGILGDGDDFVTAEYLVSGTNASFLTLSRRPIDSLTVAQSYGLASVNFLGSSNEVFFTGEPDGQVFAWTATGATNPLQRQLFSLDHAGKAWHALAAVKMLEPGEGLTGLRVDPAAPQRCDVFLWPPQSQLVQQASFPQTAPIAAILPSAATLNNLATLTSRLWDAEGNASTPYLQFQFVGATTWQDATIVALDGVPYTLATRVAALPGGANHILVWDAVTDLGPGKSTNILLRARASDMTLVGDWSVGTPFHVETSFDPDSDNDGLPDAWEIERFGNLNQLGTDDPDGDGFNNFAEYLAGTDPNLATSNLALTIHLEGGQLRLEWNAQPVVPIFLDRRTDLSPSGHWDVLQSNPAKSLLLPADSGEAYFRLRLGN